MQASKMIEKDDKRQITMLYEQMYCYMTSKDTASLGHILSDDFLLVHMTGMQQSRNAYLSAIAGGTLNYYRAETDDIIFESITDADARIVGQSRVLAAVFGGGQHTWHLQLGISLRKEDCTWKISRAVASTY